MVRGHALGNHNKDLNEKDGQFIIGAMFDERASIGTPNSNNLPIFAPSDNSRNKRVRKLHTSQGPINGER